MSSAQESGTSDGLLTPVAGDIESAPGVIVLLRTAQDDLVMAQLEAELSSSSWNVIEIDYKDSGRRPLGEIAAALDANAVLLAGDDRLSVKIWVKKTDRARASVEETIFVDSPELAEQVLAFRVTEALRAHGLRIRPRGAPDKSPPPETLPPPPRPPRPPRKGLLLFELAPALGGSPGGLPLELSGYAGLGVRLHDRVSVSALAALPLLGQKVEGDEGNATIRTYLAGGALETFLVSRPSWQLGTQLGAVATISEMKGSASEGFISTTDIVISTAPLAGLSCHVDLTPRMQAVARFVGGATFPEIQVRFGDREVATFGRPFLLGTIGLQFAAFGR